MIDIGANLSRFDEHELKKMLIRADHAGLTKIIATGTSLDSSYSCRNIANTHVEIYFSAGCHPHSARHWQAIDLETMDQFFRNPKCVFVGETGLDYHRMLSTKDEQHYAFIKQIELAIKYDMPLFLHERHAHNDFLNILDSFKDKLPPVIVHCFTGNKHEVKEYVDRGFYLGITGWLCDDARSRILQEAVPLIPDDKLLVETDAPYLAPKGEWLKHLAFKLDVEKGNRVTNEPFALPAVIAACAHYRNQTFEHVREVTSKNSMFFIERRINLTIPDMVNPYATPLY